MRHTSKILLLAGALAVLPLLGAQTAVAKTGIGITLAVGGIEVAYRDGYWDRDHHWHRWHDRQEAERYRAAYPDKYYDRDHDGDYYRDNRNRDRDYDRDRDHDYR